MAPGIKGADRRGVDHGAAHQQANDIRTPLRGMILHRDAETRGPNWLQHRGKLPLPAAGSDIFSRD